jgi:hypothetical protein
MAAKPDPRHQRPPKPGSRRWVSEPLDAALSPDQHAAKQRRRRAAPADKCICWGAAQPGQTRPPLPDPCNPLTGCDRGCKPCATRGPLITHADLRELLGREVA